MTDEKIEQERSFWMTDLLNIKCGETDDLIKLEEDVEVKLWDGLDLRTVAIGYFIWNDRCRSFDFITNDEFALDMNFLDQYNYVKSIINNII